MGEGFEAASSWRIFRDDEEEGLEWKERKIESMHNSAKLEF